MHQHHGLLRGYSRRPRLSVPPLLLARAPTRWPVTIALVMFVLLSACGASTRDLDAPELAENRRQVAEWEQTALADLRGGRVSEAVSAYDDHDRIITGDNAEVLRQRLVDDWWTDYQADQPGLMIAGRRADVADLNDRAQALCLAASEVSGDVALRVGDRVFYGGDDIIATTTNHYDLDILNGDTGYISGIDPDTKAITFWSERANGERVMPAEFIEAGHLDLGYARTNYKTQGATVDRVYVLGDDGDLDRQSAYTALSRGRLENRLYVLQPEIDLDLAADQPGLFDPNPQGAQRPQGREEVLGHVERELSRDRTQHLASEHLHHPDETIDLREFPEDLAGAWAEADRLDQTINVRASYDPSDRIAQIDEQISETTAKLDAFQGAASEAQERLDSLSGVRGVGRKNQRHQAQLVATGTQNTVESLTERIESYDREREPLADQLTAHQEWLADTEGDRARRAELAGHIDGLAWDEAVELEANPPEWLTHVIGEPADTDAGRERWLGTAGDIVSYRTHYGFEEPFETLGPRPDLRDTTRRNEYEHVDLVIRATQRDLARLEPDHAHQLGRGIERDDGLGIGL